jgi:hypothetical protein
VVGLPDSSTRYARLHAELPDSITRQAGLHADLAGTRFRPPEPYAMVLNFSQTKYFSEQLYLSTLFGVNNMW